MRTSTLVALAVSLSFPCGCGKKPTESDDAPIRRTAPPPAATPSGSPSGGAANPTPAAAPAVQIAERAVKAGWMPDGKRWIRAFKFSLPTGAPTGASWADARKACISSGLDLCTEDQWSVACSLDSTVGSAPSWTVTPGADGWVVRGGAGCASSAEADGATTAPGRVGLCCERGAAISSTKKGDGLVKAADVYVGLVEDALNSTSPQKIIDLIADPAKLFKTEMTHEQALKDLRADAQKYAEWNYRLLRCDADVGTDAGSFECDTVETRVPKGQTRELSVFRMRFEYGPPRLKYTVFADPVRIMRKWSAY